MRYAICVTLFFLGCDHKGSGIEPEFTGCATDESWVTFDDQEPNVKKDDAQGPPLTAPAAGTLAPSPKPVFTWHQDASTPGQPAGDVPHDGPGCNDCCPQWNTGALTTLHLPPLSGNLYDLKFSVGGEVVHRVNTTLQAWTPRDATWASWKGKTVSLTITRLSVLSNDPKAGPFRRTEPYTFVVN
jgi:hypothetical protein